MPKQHWTLDGMIPTLENSICLSVLYDKPFRLPEEHLSNPVSGIGIVCLKKYEWL